MGLSIVLLAIIAVAATLIFMSKLPLWKKLLFIALVIIILIGLLTMLFIYGFDRGLEPRRG